MVSINTLISSIIVVLLPVSAIIPETDIICWKQYWWAYVDGKIYVCNTDQFTQFYIDHEKWHYIWDKILTQEQKKEYRSLYLLARWEWLKAFYRPYGYNDMEEDFADNFALLQTKENSNPHVMKRIRLVKKFLTQ